jgi:acyl-coenzyme A synthetase/AMP-(fatty) acid ligase
MAEDVAVNTPLTFSPSTVIALIATTIISATMTAYSTAVGPSSLLKNLTNFSCKAFIGKSPGRKRHNQMCNKTIDNHWISSEVVKISACCGG